MRGNVIYSDGESSAGLCVPPRPGSHNGTFTGRLIDWPIIWHTDCCLTDKLPVWVPDCKTASWGRQMTTLVQLWRSFNSHFKTYTRGNFGTVGSGNNGGHGTSLTRFEDDTPIHHLNPDRTIWNISFHPGSGVWHWMQIVTGIIAHREGGAFLVSCAAIADVSR